MKVFRSLYRAHQAKTRSSMWELISRTGVLIKREDLDRDKYTERKDDMKRHRDYQVQTKEPGGQKELAKRTDTPRLTLLTP